MKVWVSNVLFAPNFDMAPLLYLILVIWVLWTASLLYLSCCLGQHEHLVPQLEPTLALGGMHAMFNDSISTHYMSSDAIWCHGFCTTQVQIIVSCLRATSHCLGHCWVWINCRFYTWSRDWTVGKKTSHPSAIPGRTWMTDMVLDQGARLVSAY